MDYEIIIDSFGDEHIVITHTDGSHTTMLKSIWDELEAAKEQSGTL